MRFVLLVVSLPLIAAHPRSEAPDNDQTASDTKRVHLPAPFSSKKEPVVCLQGEALTCYSPAYNAPAAIDTNYKPKCSEINFYVDAAFTYWYAGEEGLKLASTGALSNGVSYFATNTKALFQDFSYAPGFQVSFGVMGSHEWIIDAGYTWYRGEFSTSTHSISGTTDTAGVPEATAPTGVQSWLVDDWFLQGTSNQQALSGPAISSKWHLGVDLIDVTASRPYYQGRRLILMPEAGLRAALIRQSLTVDLTENSTIFVTGTEPSQPISSHNHSNSWAIGPRFGLAGQTILPKEFRFEGNLAISLLYTNYTSIKHSEDAASTAFNSGPYKASFNNYSCLRPIGELGLGIGWGRYFRNRDFHIDFSADYDFMLFWGQNMIRKLLDDTLTGTSPFPSDLYLHGLTVTGRFDF